MSVPKALPQLESGDIVDVIAPASSCSKKLLDSGIKELKAWGLKPRVPKDIFSKAHRFCANSEEYQAKHLIESLKAKDSKAVLCVRGGYGTQRLIPYLKKMRKPSHAKFFVGYSDITWLHHFLNSQWGWRTLHGPFVCEYDGATISKSSIENLKKIMFGQVDQVQFRHLQSMNGKALKSKGISGRIVGGNLKLLQTTAGTDFPFKSGGKILFFEETGERGYAIDRMLVHMEQAGQFKGARAIVVGQVTGGAERDGKSFTWQALQDFAERTDIPMFKGLPSGHGKKNQTVPLNCMATIHHQPKPFLTVDLKK